MNYIDLTYLNSVTGGDTAFMTEMISIFLEQISEFQENLTTYLKQGKFDELGKEAHKAKSSVIIMGMDQLGKDLKQLQLLTQESTETDHYSAFVNDFIEKTDGAVVELEEVLATF